MNRRRTLESEWMDNPGLEARQHDEALAGLARINRISGTLRAVWKPLRGLARRHGPLRVMDLACGGGDVAVALAAQAKREQVPIEMHGCDRSARALRVARANAERAGVEAGVHNQAVFGRVTAAKHVTVRLILPQNQTVDDHHYLQKAENVTDPARMVNKL